tara:strand:+ start:1351 stop:1641 length:291 start_codon:yes stop_codon:yes gene_type:complete
MSNDRLSDDRLIEIEENIGIGEVLSSIREWLDFHKENFTDVKSAVSLFDEHTKLREIVKNCETEIHNYINECLINEESSAIDNAMDMEKDRKMGIE